jgi:hypothetical protein
MKHEILGEVEQLDCHPFDVVATIVAGARGSFCGSTPVGSHEIQST